jgi:hypothetical protein
LKYGAAAANSSLSHQKNLEVNLNHFYERFKRWLFAQKRWYKGFLPKLVTG